MQLAALHPFRVYRLGQGCYTRMAPFWECNFQSDVCSVPLGARLGKVIRTEKVVQNLFREPQYSVLDRGDGQPERQIFGAVNLQCKG